MDEPVNERLLKPGEVARIFNVNVKTVGRWAQAGVLTAIRPLPGGHPRYRESQVRELLNGKDN